MAIIGRVTCPWCGFHGAHVKQNDGKLPFVHCPQDGILTQARNAHQAALLLAKMRPANGGDDGPTPPATDSPITMPTPATPPATTPPAPPKKPPGLFEQLMGKKA